MNQPKVLTELNVNELAGKNGLVAFFFPRANTEGCTIEVNEFNHHLDDFKALGYNVVGVTTSKVKENEKFIQAQGLKFPLVSDLTKKITNDRFNNLISKRINKKWNVLALTHKQPMRTTFILDTEGNIKATLREVNPISSARDALDKIDEIQKTAKIKNAAIDKGVNEAVAKNAKKSK